MDKKIFDARKQAFNDHMRWWLDSNQKALLELTPEDVAKGAAASAWNQALSWAAKQAVQLATLK